jgi:16S rRNA (cytidine1402-2'-O)-methyltransferase
MSGGTPNDGTKSNTLFVVGTPIGHLSDLTARAIEALTQAKFVVAEDTRRARQLLSHLGIVGKSIVCVDAHATQRDLDQVAARVAQGESCAMVTDAGMPSVSDPGAQLVATCRALGAQVVVVPGPSAVTTALAASGFGGAGFWFAGFLPRKGEKRAATLTAVAEFEDSVVLFEAPTRMEETLKDLAEFMPERALCVARELTKQFEEVRVQRLSEWAAEERSWRGELTLVLGPQELAAAGSSSEADLDLLIAPRLSRGLSPKSVAEELAPFLRVSRRTIYQRVLQLIAAQA